MKRLYFLLFLLILTSNLGLSQDTIHVPADYASIQAAINTSYDGDIVLVEDGTYIESINFYGKAITVASHYYIDENENHIDNTIINSIDESAVRFLSGETTLTQLCGFSIKNGTGMEDPRPNFVGSKVGGGICCYQSSPKIVSCKISENNGATYGGGIFCSNSDAILKNLKIYSNNATMAGAGLHIYYSTITLENSDLFENRVAYNDQIRGNGGGIYSDNSYLLMDSVRIFKNSAIEGGGFYDWFSDSINMKSVKIYNNTAICGGGLYQHNGYPINFDSINRCSIYLNEAFKGNDAFGLGYNNVVIPLDTFTVLQPTKYFVGGGSHSNFDILHAKKEKITGNIYVDDGGSNENSGLLLSDPLKSIALALELVEPDSLNLSTIFVADGDYGFFSNYETYPLIMRSNTVIQGQSLNNVLLSAGLNYGSYYWNTGVFILGGVTNCSIKNLQINGGAISYDTDGYGGVLCEYSDCEIDSVLIYGNSGSGITGDHSNLRMTNSRIENNNSRYGGGINAYYSDLDVINSKILNNKSELGGGIYAKESSVSLSGTSLHENDGSKFGGGIYLTNSEISFDPDNLNSLYLNKALQGGDIYTDGRETINLNLDTFTVDKSTHYYSFPSYLYNCNIQNHLNILISSDFFISPSGNNSNSGLSADSPLRSFTLALSKIYTDSSNYHTIFISEGNYNLADDNDSIPIYLNDYVNIEGWSTSGTILDANELSSVFNIHNNKYSSISNLSVTGGYNIYGGGIFLDKSNLYLNNVLFAGNTSTGYYPGGWSYVPGSGGGLFSDQSEVYLNHVTFANNQSINWEAAGGAFGLIHSSINIVNSILWSNLPEEIYCDSSNIAVAYSDVMNGSDSIKVSGNSQIFWLDGNIDSDPLFRDTSEFNYQLTPTSPCIDVAVHDTVIYYNSGNDSIAIPPISFIGSGSDMGAFEFDPNVVVTDDKASPTSFSISQNYPNPFNPSTTIKYSVPQKSKVVIKVFDILGNEIATLVNEEKPAGTYELTWNAADLPSGVYFYQLKAGGFVQTKKMVLLK